MNIPPAILDLTITPDDGRRVHLWLPLFLLWPLVLVIVVLALALAIVADIVLLISGRPYHHFTLLIARSLEALCETRGMVLRFSDGNATVDMTVQ